MSTQRELKEHGMARALRSARILSPKPNCVTNLWSQDYGFGTQAVNQT